MLPIECLTESGKEHVIPLVERLIESLGLEFYQRLVIEMKFMPKKKEAEGGKEGKQDEDKQDEGKQDEGKQDEDMQDEDKE